MANEPRRSTQYFAALGATMGGFCLGTVIGWASPAKDLLEAQLPNAEHLSWVGSIMALGAAAAQIYMAFTLDLFGRKLSMLINAVPFIFGWIIVASANSVLIYCVGRFITGFFGGTFCIAAPAYIGEVADKNIRGTLGVCFQLLITMGILVSYSLGEFNNLIALTVPLIAGPIVVLIIFIFLPESPVFLYKQGNAEKAKTVMQYFRGPNYDISAEMKDIDQYVKTEDSFWAKFKTRASVKACLMVVGMNIVQQLSGINAVMFYSHTIFRNANASLEPGHSSIVMAVVQVAVTAVSAYCVDRAGRRLLWIVSLSTMGICLVLLGVYFSIQNSDPALAKKLSWLPILAICVYIAGFSLATGPLPWVMLAEFLPNAVKGYIGSGAACLNWLLAFAIANSFENLVKKYGQDKVFWAYAIVCGAGLVFVIMFLIETKDKSLEEIQEELGTPPT